MELSWFEDLIALSKCLNFSRAADMRNVTQPAYSRRIRALEDWVGEALVDRSSHRIAFTPAGDVMLEVADDVLRSLEVGRQEARQAMGRGPSLRFASTHALSLTVFPRMMKTLDPSLAAVPIQLFADNMVGCERLMLEGAAQFLLCHHHPSAPTKLRHGEYSWTVIGEDRLVPICRRSEAGDTSLPLPGDPARPTPLLSFDENSGLGRIINAVRPEGLAGTATLFTSHLAVALKAMAVEGKGMAWLPLSLVEDELGAAGRLTRFDRPDLDIPVEIVLLRPTKNLGTAAEELWRSISCSHS